MISITVKNVDAGKVSPRLVRHGRAGTILGLGGVEGEFVLPDGPPARILFVSAGSGITPIMSMLRHLDHADRLGDIVLLHSARRSDDVIFGAELRALAARHNGVRLHEQHTGGHGRMRPADLERLCPDWRRRETFLSGPTEMLDAFTEQWEREGDRDRLHLERFQPRLALGGDAAGEGGTITFLHSERQAESDGSTPILLAGEEAGLALPFGCREGICHTCVGTLASGRVRDLRSGRVHGQEGEKIRTCISAPEGPIEISL